MHHSFVSKVAVADVSDISNAGTNKTQEPGSPGLPSSHLREPTVYAHSNLKVCTGHIPALEAAGTRGLCGGERIPGGECRVELGRM